MSSGDGGDAQRFDAVVFDFDGVIVDSESVGVELDRRVLAEHGVALTTAEVAARFLGSSEEFHEAELDRLLGGAFSTSVAAQYDERYDELFERVPATPEVAAALARLRVPAAIASNNSRSRIVRTLDRLGLGPVFGERIAAREDVVRGKPSPDVYLHAAGLLGIPPSRCAAVEDSLPGIHAALAAGMTVFGFSNPYTPDKEMASAGAIPLHRMADLPALVRGNVG